MKTYQSNRTVELLNCEVKPSRLGEGYEVMLKSSTQIRESPKKLDVAALKVDASPKVVSLEDLDGLAVFDRATVNIKAVEMKEEMNVKGKVKQDVIVADGSGTATVSVWEGHVNEMKVNCSYCLKNLPST